MEKQVKKRILLVNVTCSGSTGKICKEIYDIASRNGFECCIAYGRGTAPEGYRTIKIGNDLDVYYHVLKTRLFDEHGLASKKATTHFIDFINQYKPDVIHLHNIHGYYLNYRILFEYLKKHEDIKVVWTLHDCWAFTGHCSYYLEEKCHKWLNGCKKCSLIGEYPKSFTDRSLNNWIDKRDSFSIGRKINVVCVSEWLKTQVEQSFLADNNLFVIRNGVDKSVFQFEPSDVFSEYKKRGLCILLGVANVWGERKGLRDFIDLADKLNGKYKLVLVGLTERQISHLPSNITGMPRTQNINDLVKIYSAADLYINFSREETFGMTNYEAQACGTPVISYDNGGSPETIVTKDSAIIENTVDAALNYINLKNGNFGRITDLSNIRDSRIAYYEYLELYERI